VNIEKRVVVAFEHFMVCGGHLYSIVVTSLHSSTYDDLPSICGVSDPFFRVLLTIYQGMSSRLFGAKWNEDIGVVAGVGSIQSGREA